MIKSPYNYKASFHIWIHKVLPIIRHPSIYKDHKVIASPSAFPSLGLSAEPSIDPVTEGSFVIYPYQTTRPCFAAGNLYMYNVEGQMNLLQRS